MIESVACAKCKKLVLCGELQAFPVIVTDGGKSFKLEWGCKECAEELRMKKGEK